MKNILVSLLFIGSIFCGYSQMPSAHSNSNIRKVIVKKVLQTSSYTYLYVQEGDVEKWVAVPSVDAKVNDVYYYTGGMEMRDFKSTQLDTVFSSLWFLQGVYDEKTISQGSEETAHKPENITSTDKAQVIIPVDGGVTIAQLITNKEDYSNKTVVLRGRVTKFSSKIMGTNWIHLNDGSSTESDITITTDSMVKIGDILTIKGVIILDKDFGYGYFYKVLMQNGVIINK